jgi:uncharacterized protein YndB with AHSA1/START domain
MKQNILTIIINLPIETVFEYTTNPDNTHKWVNSIQKEQINENPIKVGTEYKNTSDGKNWTTYIVTDFIPNQVFELQEKDGNYFVRYSYEKISEHETKLIYHEWNHTEGLSALFGQDVLDNLKLVIENKNQD